MAFDPFTEIISPVVALPIDNVDTDQIIPARFLKATSREASFGEKLFADWRYLPSGDPDPDFPLNKYSREARILIAGENFGCGSSREHAAWSLYDYGFRVVIAPSFADIFRNNALNNGILIIAISKTFQQELLSEIQWKTEIRLKVNLPDKYISVAGTETRQSFDLNPFRSQCLQEGLDLLDFLMARKDQILKFEQLNTSS